MSGETAPLRIVMVDSHAEIERGGAIQCARLAASLAERGHDVRCIFNQAEGAGSSGPYWDRMSSAGVRIERHSLTSLRSMWRFGAELAASPPDIVHTHKNRAAYFVAGATLGRGEFGWVANRGTEYSLRRDPLAWAIHRWWIDRIVAVAEAVRRQVIRDGVPPDRVRTVYGSFDADRFDPAVSGAAMRAAWDVPAEAALVGMAASFKSRKKGQDDFLRAAAMALRSGVDAVFILAGDGPAEPLREQAKQLGIADRVRFPGFVSDMPAALAALDVVVCASTRGEGLTGSLREALAMARPVVSTDVAGNRELVRSGKTGVLTPPGDPAALAVAFSDLLADPARAAAMGTAGRDLVLALCTDEVRTNQVEAIYRELIARKRRQLD